MPAFCATIEPAINKNLSPCIPLEFRLGNIQACQQRMINFSGFACQAKMPWMRTPWVCPRAPQPVFRGSEGYIRVCKGIPFHAALLQTLPGLGPPPCPHRAPSGDMRPCRPHKSHPPRPAAKAIRNRLRVPGSGHLSHPLEQLPKLTACSCRQAVHLPPAAPEHNYLYID